MPDKRKTYKQLEKLRQFELDRLTKRKGELDEQVSTFEYLIDQLEREAVAEAKNAEENPDLKAYLGAYLAQNEARRKEFRGALERIHRQLDELQELIMNAYMELKQVDIAHAQAEQEFVKEEAKQVQKELDDLSIMRQSQKSS